MSQLPKPKKPKVPELPEEPKLPDLPEALTRSILTEYKPRSEYPCYYRVSLKDKDNSFDAGEIVERYEAIINLELNQRLEAGFKNYVLRRFENVIDIFKMNTFGRANLDTNHCYVSNFRNMGLYQSITFSYVKRYWDNTTLQDLTHKMDDLMVNVLVNCFSGPDTPLVPLNQVSGINVRQHYKIKERHSPHHISYRLWDDVVKRGSITKFLKAKKKYRFTLINNKQLPLNKKGDIMTQLIKF